MLDAGAFVEVQVLLDLALLAAGGGLVDGELDAAVAVAHHLAHQGGELGGDVVVVEADQLLEVHHVGVPLHPFVHLAQGYVAHHVVDELQPDGGGAVFRVPGGVAGQEGSPIVLPFHEFVDGVTETLNLGADAGAVFILGSKGRTNGRGPPLHGGVESQGSVLHPKGDAADGVPVEVVQPADLRTALQRAGQHQADLVLHHHVALPVADPRAQAGVGQGLKSHATLVEVSGLAGVAHVEFHVVGAQQGKTVGGGEGGGGGGGHAR